MLKMNFNKPLSLILIFYFFSVTGLISCDSTGTGDHENNNQVGEDDSLSPNENHSCQYKKQIFRFRNPHLSGDVELPIAGQFVREAHFVTSDSEDPKYPDGLRHQIQEHLSRSCDYLWANYDFLKTDEVDDQCDRIYHKVGAGVWTPAEGGGNFGQGSIGHRWPTTEQELWQANMWWNRSIPPAGTKFIVKSKKNGRAVVVSMGYESGPSETQFIGGISPEADFYLKNDTGHTETDEELIVGVALDQSIPYGPIDCALSSPDAD